MKLIYCPYCKDVVRLIDKRRECGCGKSWGNYVDHVLAELGGAAVPVGIGNKSFVEALRERAGPAKRAHMRLDAFLIKEPCDTVRRV